MSAAAEQVFEDPEEREAELARLGLRSAILKQAILDGYIAKLACTANDPPSFPGFTFWAVTTRSLREQLIPIGWGKSDRKNYSTIVSPEGSLAVVVATGDSATGTKEPGTNKCPKGSATVAAVEVNYELFELSEIIKSIAADPDRAKETWMLLIAIEMENETRVIRAELDLPSIIEKGHVVKWRRRIVLEGITDTDGGAGERGPGRGPEPGPDFDVDVSRRKD